MKSSKRLLATVMVLIMVISSMSLLANAVKPSDFTDFPHGSWSEEAVTAAIENDLLHGRNNGTIGPKDYLLRAEAAAIINRAFGATVKANISKFTDVSKDSWYYADIQKAVNMQTIMGVSNSEINPEGNITRESIFTVVARALVLPDGNKTILEKFSDKESISEWAVPKVAAMVARGYINGDDLGNINPQAFITREEFAQLMHNIFKVYISESGTVSNATYATTVIRTPNVKLSNVTINGDLIIGDGVGAGNIDLSNVKVTGRILFRGGEGKVTFSNKNSVGEYIIVHDVNGTVNFNNYRTDAIFKNIVLDTAATFLKKTATGATTRPSTPPGPGPQPNPAILGFDYEDSTDKVKVYVTLDKLPIDVQNLVAINLAYKQDPDATLTFESVKSLIGGDISGTNGTISWYIPQQFLTSVPADKRLFEITFAKTALTPATIVFTYVLNGVELKDSVGKTATGYTTESKTINITTQVTPPSTTYRVTLYEGTKNNRGYYDIPKNEYITQDQINAKLGDPSTYSFDEGYKDSDGNVHKILPELWYKVGTEWERFIPTEVKITKDTDVYLLTRYISFKYNTDFSVKGIDVPEISIDVAYDSNTNIGQSVLDALTATRTSLSRALNVLNTQGVDPYEIATNKLMNFGLLDADGNILNKEVAVPLHKFVTENFIISTINEYIDDNIDNEEFIAKILRNDHVVDTLIKKDSIKTDVMKDKAKRDFFLTTEVKEHIYNHPTVKEWINKEVGVGSLPVNIPVDDCIEEVIKRYNDNTLDSKIRAIINTEINDHMLDLINNYINDIDREDIGKFIADCEKQAVDAFKATDAFKNTITDFTSGNGVRVHKDNEVLVSIMADVLGGYDYEHFKAELLPEKLVKLTNIIGDDVLEKYVMETLQIFVDAMESATDNVERDVNNNITDTEYKFTTSPEIIVNYMNDFVVKYYDKLYSKLQNKAYATGSLCLDRNVAAKALVDTDWVDLYFENTGVTDTYKSGYKIKDNLMEYYDITLEQLVLLHDAIVWYGTQDEMAVQDKMEAISTLANTYFDKANNIVMNYIDNGELPKGFTVDGLMAQLESVIDSVLGKNDSLNKIEELRNSDKVKKLIDKAINFYEEYLDRDYVNEPVDIANIEIYSDDKAYNVYKIALEMYDDAFDIDDVANAIKDSPNYKDVSKAEAALAKLNGKLAQFKINPQVNINRFYVDAYKAALESKEIAGKETGAHTLEINRYLTYIK